MQAPEGVSTAHLVAFAHSSRASPAKEEVDFLGCCVRCVGAMARIVRLVGAKHGTNGIRGLSVRVDR